MPSDVGSEPIAFFLDRRRWSIKVRFQARRCTAFHIAQQVAEIQLFIGGVRYRCRSCRSELLQLVHQRDEMRPGAGLPSSRCVKDWTVHGGLSAT
jgi:hypothetical protein